ncbi:MAG TPA: hypothetical protein PLB88_09195, partial [Thermoanaerobaculaceae bacterium]|nr:hypothetical protein [Thermoanaerobaculaceae bacterium]
MSAKAIATTADEAFSSARTGKPFQATLMRGQGRPDSPYNEHVPQEAILGGGRWTTPDAAFAAHFGPTITQHQVQLQNPLVIRTDAEWRALTRGAGWKYPNPFGGDPAAASADIARLRGSLEASGHDGVVIDPSRHGDDAKTLSDVFGPRQVVEFQPPEAAAPGPRQAATQPATQAEPAPEPETEAPGALVPTQAATACDVVEHVTRRGKTLRGVIRRDLTAAQAKDIDPGTFRKDNGWFLRLNRLPGTPPETPEAAEAEAPKARAPEQAAAPVAPDQREIGRNSEGDPLFEDARGVRSIVRNGVRQFEAVRVTPTGTLILPPARARSSMFEPAEVEAPGQIAPLTMPEAASEDAFAALGTPYGADNQAVVTPIAEEAKARLRAAHDVLAHGGDEATDIAGEALAAYHLEAGATSFGDYQQAMLGDLGRVAEPFLRRWYDAARERTGVPAEEMTAPEHIEPLPLEPEVPTSGAETEDVGNGDQLSGQHDSEPVPGPDAGPGAPDVQRPDKERGTPRAPQVGAPAGARADEGGAGERTPRPGRPPAEPERGAIGEGAGAGDAGGVQPGAEREPGAAGRSAEAADPDAIGRNYTIEPGALAEDRSPRQKAEGNLAAIRLVKRLDVEGRLPSRAEQDVLAQYVGWGGLSGAFPLPGDEPRKEFAETARALRELLTPEEHKQASASTQYAHYTSEAIVRSMWDGMRRMGFRGGLAFEPGMGTGNFVGMMPKDIAARTQYSGIERDPITARVAHYLYPDSGVREADFTTVPLPPRTFDLVIGNPPFSDVVVKADPAYRARNFMLHDYFFAKSIDSLRPGGVLGFVTSAGTMNKIDPSAREYIARRAAFVGGIRLPSDAFAKNAGTQVTTDILFFQRRPEDLDKDASLDEEKAWTETVPRTLPDATGKPTAGRVNRYFSEHPEMVLGNEGFFDKLYQGRYAVHARPGEDFGAQLAAAIARLPEGIYQAQKTPRQRAEADFEAPETKEGSFYLAPDGRLMQYSTGVGREIARRGAGTEGGFTSTEIEKIRGLLPVRDALRDVIRHDLADTDEEAAAEARARLNQHYDAFVSKHGPINKELRRFRRPSIVEQESAILEAREEARTAGAMWDDGSFDPRPFLARRASLAETARARAALRKHLGSAFQEATLDPADLPDVQMTSHPNIDPFEDDPESYRLRSIESYDEATDRGTKRRVFRESVIARQPEPEIRSANDGALWSLNQYGRLDLDRIAEKMGRTRDSIIDELGDTIFRLPGADDTYQTASEYLSGDVVTKLEAAIDAQRRTNDPTLERNINALRAAQPVPLAPEEITMGLGMPWIGTELPARFAAEHLRIGDPRITYQPKLGNWQVEHGWNGDKSGLPVWGVENLDAYGVLKAALNHVPPRVYRPKSGGEKGTEFDPVATQAARDLVEKMSREFEGWIEAQPDVRTRLAETYNAKMNRVVPRQYDGSYLTTPGVASDWSWRPHQTKVV